MTAVLSLLSPTKGLDCFKRSVTVLFEGSTRFNGLLFMFMLDKLPTIFAVSLSNHHLPPRFIRLFLSFRRFKYIHNFVNKANSVYNSS